MEHEDGEAQEGLILQALSSASLLCPHAQWLRGRDWPAQSVISLQTLLGSAQGSVVTSDLLIRALLAVRCLRVVPDDRDAFQADGRALAYLFGQRDDDAELLAELSKLSESTPATNQVGTPPGS